MVVDEIRRGGRVSNPDEGFGAAKGALDQAKQHTTWLNQQINDGKLRMNPESAEAAAKHCEDYEREVRSLRRRAAQTATVNGLGDYGCSLALKHHFEQKAGHPESGSIALLEQLRTELLNLADAYRNAGKAYCEQEDQIADDFRKGLE